MAEHLQKTFERKFVYLDWEKNTQKQISKGPECNSLPRMLFPGVFSIRWFNFKELYPE